MSKAVPQNKSLFKSLIERGVFQVLGVYLGVSWGLIQFVDWVANRYGLSSHLPEFAFVLLLTMLPTVALLSYYHNDPHREKWGNIEKIGVPTNVIFSAALLMVLFQGKELGAASQTITLVDENGKTIHRVVPKNEFRKKLLITFFENRTGNPDLDWARLGLGFMTSYDLIQDHFFASGSVIYFDDDLKELGFSIGEAVPHKVQLSVAQKRHFDYLLSGDFDEENGETVIRYRLTRVAGDEMVAENKIANTGLLGAVDAMVKRLKEDLEVPRMHRESVRDLPLEDILSSNPRALQTMMKAMEILQTTNDYNAAGKKLEEAIVQDSTFALAHLQKLSVYANLGNQQKTVEALESAKKYQYKFPEIYQFILKSTDYQLQGNGEKRLAILKMWAELYPEDLVALFQLANLYKQSGNFAEAARTYERIQEIDPTQYGSNLDLGDTYLRDGNYEKAFAAYQRYADHFPEEHLGWQKMANSQELKGEFQKAEELLRKALAKDEKVTSLYSDLADIAAKKGEFDQAKTYYLQALERSELPKDKSRALKALTNFHWDRLECQKALGFNEEMIDNMRSFAFPLDLEFARLELAARYLEIGEWQKGKDIIESVVMVPPFEKGPNVAWLIHAVEQQDTSLIKQYLPLVEDFAQKSDIWFATYLGACARGVLAFQRGNLQEGATAYQEARDLSALKFVPVQGLARIYLAQGDADKALEILNQYLKTYPYHGQANLEKARLLKNRGDGAGAASAISKA
ncbi:MAG TPA: tetratricopeptide repeat protein, partial [Calditrichia bacterium]|nr:tetratricopeptide repeat protein [Calditrichia bacterium]